LKPAVTRVVLYSLVALALAGALRFTPPLPEMRPAGDVLTTQQGSPSWKLRFDTLARGESLAEVLRRGGLNDAAVARAIRASALDARRLRAGTPVIIKSDSADAPPSEVTLQLAIDRLVHLKRSGDAWTGNEEHLPWTTDTVVVAGTIASNLYAAMDVSAKDDLPDNARQQLTWALAEVYQYRVDMSRDLQQGDQFKVMAERQVGPGGLVRIGAVLAATFKLSGSTIKAVHFPMPSDSGAYFDQDGKSMRGAFLHVPLEFRRISSVFGGREHPILGGWRMHKGIDYAAAAGTQVHAIGDGVVIRAGWSNGYGNVLEIRHPNGFVSRYGHLRAYAAGIRVGTHVPINKVIAFVGSTGLSTGPHLHFEILVNGVQRDPKAALKHVGGEPLPATARSAFTAVRDRLVAWLDTPATTGLTKVAQQ
jgi:murein DD-endopeptidase MepM/ murein hydrolase activator NlpD